MAWYEGDVDLVYPMNYVEEAGKITAHVYGCKHCRTMSTYQLPIDFVAGIVCPNCGAALGFPERLRTHAP